MKNLTVGIEENTECCYNCNHYIQHYAFHPTAYYQPYSEVNYGHCRYPRVRVHSPTDWCEFFQRRSKKDGN